MPFAGDGSTPGDVGMIDEEGVIFLMDRKADMIITGGENVYPKETEDVLYTHPRSENVRWLRFPTKNGEKGFTRR